MNEIKLLSVQADCYSQKYSTTSSVFSDQSVANPDYQKTLYTYVNYILSSVASFVVSFIAPRVYYFSISCLLQAEIFEDIAEIPLHPSGQYPELQIRTNLPPQSGGLLIRIPDDVLDRETEDDPDLRVQMVAGNCPALDTILRYSSISLFTVPRTRVYIDVDRILCGIKYLSALVVKLISYLSSAHFCSGLSHTSNKPQNTRRSAISSPLSISSASWRPNASSR